MFKSMMNAVVVLVLSLFAHGAVAVVGTCISGPPSYTTIQAAINAVASGDTVKVCPGTGVLLDVGANSNQLMNNTIIAGSSSSGLAIDFRCNAVTSNIAVSNTIDDFNYGIANIPTGNTTTPNTFFNVFTTQTTCP